MLGLIRTNRDTRVDFFRGYALFCIFIDHIPDHLLWITTVQVLGPADATETFIFLAGYAAALAYGRQVARNGWPFAATSVGLRAWNLYVVHIFMFVVFIGQVSWSAARFANPAYLDETNVGGFLAEPYVAVLDALSLRFQPSFMDILPLYIVMLLWFALLLPLLARPALMLAASFAPWLVVRVTHVNLPTSTGVWFFNPLAWQFLFIIGAVLGNATDAQRDRLLAGRWYLTLGAVLVALAGLFVSAAWRIPAVPDMLPPIVNDMLGRIDKTGLHPARLLHFLAIAYLASRLIPRDSRFPLHPLALPFTLCGQHGLMVFSVGIFLSFLGRLVMQEIDASFAIQLAIAAVGWGLCVLLAAIQAWYNQAGEARRRADPILASPTLASSTPADRTAP